MGRTINHCNCLLYTSVPGRTGTNIKPATAVKIAKSVDNIVAIKEASGDIGQVATLAALADGCLDKMCIRVRLQMQKKIDVKDEKVFSYLLELTTAISKYHLPIDQIHIKDDGNALLISGDITVDVYKRQVL